MSETKVWIATVFSAFSAVLLFVAVAAVAGSVSAAVAVGEGPAVMITRYEVEPEVLMPGDRGTITVTIKNMDTQSSETEETVENPSYTSKKTTISTRSISAEIETVRLSSSSKEIEWLRDGLQRSEFYNLGALGADESIKISLPIKAAAHARGDRTYFPEVCVEVKNGRDVRFPVPVRVDSSGVEILESDIPSEISASESRQIKIIVANNRPNSVSGVSVLVKSENEELEFTPERIFVGDLGAFEKRELNFTLQTFRKGLSLNKSKSGFEFEVAYKNGENRHSNEFESSVEVRSDADVKLILVNAPESVFRGEIAKLEFDVANGMSKEVKAVSVVPVLPVAPAVGEGAGVGADGVRILPSECFIGDMEEGDVFSASFDLYTGSSQRGDFKIPFRLVFKDADTDDRYESPGYEVVVEVKEPQKKGLPNQMLFVVVLGLCFAAVLLGWVGTRRRRRRGQRRK